MSSLRVGAVVAHESRRPFELRDEGVERAVGVIGGAEIAQLRMRPGGDLLCKRRQQARLADAGLAAEQHDLALSRCCAMPPFEQEGELCLPADQRRQHRRAALRNGSRRPSRRRCASTAPERRSPLSSRSPRSVAVEQARDQPLRNLGDNHRARLGERLQPRCKVGRVADDRFLLRRTFADQVADDDQSRGDADTRGKRRSPPGAVSRAVADAAARPARTARSASSSCACGQPK